MRNISIILLLILTTCSYAQTRYDKHDALLAAAAALKRAGNCEQAIKKYEKALELLVPNSSTPFFDLASCAITRNDFTLADLWIRKGIAVGGAPKSYLRSYKGFDQIQEEEFYKNIVADYNLLRQKYFTTIENIDLYLEIEELVARDQFVRKTGLYLDGYSQRDFQNAATAFLKATAENNTAEAARAKQIAHHLPQAKHRETIDELMVRTDSLNIARLMEITVLHGWQERAWVILWHQRGTYGEDNYIWNYFKPLIDKEIAAGTISRDFWAAFIREKEMMQRLRNALFGNIPTLEKLKETITPQEPKVKG